MTSLLPNANSVVQAYLEHQNNEADHCDTDWYGRFVLPMDMVLFQHMTDENVPLMLTGYVKRIIAGAAEVRVDVGFGIDDLLVKVGTTIKVPTNAVIEHHLLRFITALNGEICYNNPTLHYNGNVVCFAG